MKLNFLYKILQIYDQIKNLHFKYNSLLSQFIIHFFIFSIVSQMKKCILNNFYISKATSNHI